MLILSNYNDFSIFISNNLYNLDECNIYRNNQVIWVGYIHIKFSRVNALCSFFYLIAVKE